MLVFSDQTPPSLFKGGGGQSSAEDRLVLLATHQLEELAKKKSPLVQVLKHPFKSGGASCCPIVTDIKQIQSQEEEEELELLVSYSNGSLWHIAPASPGKSVVFSIESFRDQLGEQKAYQVNSLDHHYFPRLRASLALIVDAFGRLSVVQLNATPSIRFLYYEQVSYSQILSAHWLSTASFHHLRLAMITSDGQLTLGQLLQQSAAGKYELAKLCVLSSAGFFEEVPNQFNFSSHSLMRQNQIVQVGWGGTALGVLWPEKIMYKINRKKSGEKKLILQRKLSLFKLSYLNSPVSFSRQPIAK
jgi:hypothetical protein